MPLSTSSGERLDRPVRVLVIDDSAYVRKVVTQMLSKSPFLEVVGTARDGQEGLEKVAELRPDVVTCDLIMPGLDGVGFIRAQMERQPLPIVVVSIANDSAEQVLSALDAGAIDFVQKPTALATERLLDMSDDLIGKVKSAATATLARTVVPALVGPAPSAGGVATARPTAAMVDVVVMGVSTGGPQALKYLFARLPAEFPVPIAMVMHMPLGYTEAYARRLDEMSALSVSEAHGGELLLPGTALLAPAGRHLTLVRTAPDRVEARLDLRPMDTPHRPAVDVLFQSAADAFGSRVLGVVMTGMGTDGLAGAAWIKARGGCVLTEAEESCVVYGMPRAIVEAGLSDGSAPLAQLLDLMMERL